MESLIVLLLLGIPLLAAAGFILGVIALVRLRRLRAMLETLQSRIQTFERSGQERVADTVVEEPAATPRPEPAVDLATTAHHDDVAAGVVTKDSTEAEPDPGLASEAAEPPPLPTATGVPAADEQSGATTPPLDEPAVTEESEPTAPARPRVDWEQWIGVRGAAVVGAGALGLAGLLLFKYSVEQGLLSPEIRIVMGVLAGLASVIASEPLRHRSPAGANALAAGGIVVLYGAVWAANALYALVGAVPAFALMVLITLVCGLLAVRRPSQVIAVIGLAGGFATPLLVNASDAGPLGLFSYILLLDAGILWLALRQRWPLLGALALIGTALHQTLWIAIEMDAATAIFGIGVLALFSVVFLAATGTSSQAKGPAWRLTQAGALVVPFLLALRFAADSDLQPPAQLAALIVLLVLSGTALAWRQDRPGLASGSVSGALGVLAVWLFNLGPDTEVWVPLAIVAALPVIAQLVVELQARTGGSQPTANAVLIGAIGGSVIVSAASEQHAPAVWSFLGCWAIHAAVLIRHAIRLPQRAAVHLVAGLTIGIGTLAVVPESELSLLTKLSVLLTVAVASQLVVLTLRRDATARWAGHGAGAATMALLAAAVVVNDATHLPTTVMALGTVSALGVGGLLVAAHARFGGWSLAATIATAGAQLFMVGLDFGSSEQPIAVLAALAATVVLFAAWPLLTGDALRGTKLAWHSAAGACAIWFLPLVLVWENRFGDAALGFLPVALAAVAIAMLAGVRTTWAGPDPVRREATVWFAAVALCLVSSAIPLQLEREWITVGWAVNAAAVLALWRRFDHAGLKYLSLILFTAVTIRLLANPHVLSYHPGGGPVLVNWLAYTYLVPAVALLTSAAWVRPLEAARLRSWEPRRPVFAPLLGLAAVAVIFAWINLTIVHAFSAGGPLQLTLERLPARDLTTSLAWAGYAVLLLVIGLVRSSTHLRWVSLLLLILTILKVFLHDLGELEDLYRVASLVGLAGSLIAVSIFYQRFAFRSARLGPSHDHSNGKEDQ